MMMPIKHFLLMLLLLSISSVSVVRSGPVLPTILSNTRRKPLDASRPRRFPILDQVLAGKLWTGAYLLQGTAFWIAPATTLKTLYRMRGTSSITYALCSDFGSDLIATGIIAYRLLLEKRTQTNNKAVGSAFLFLLVSTMMTLVSDRQAAVGAELTPISARLVVVAVGAIAAFTDKTYASNLAFANAYFRLIDGVLTIMDPIKAGRTWGVRLVQGADIFMMRALGFGVTICSAVMVTLLSGAESVKALSYGSFLALTYFLNENFITKEWERAGMHLATNYVGVIFFGITLWPVYF